jgi:hypothetical protein
MNSASPTLSEMELTMHFPCPAHELDQRLTSILTILRPDLERDGVDDALPPPTNSTSGLASA